MANMELMMPKTMAEQKIIGQYFANLDRLIILHQRELAEVGKYKKALMQLLLTGLVRVNAQRECRCGGNRTGTPEI